MERAREPCLICFSSPFDETAIDFLEELGELDAGCTQLALLKCTSTYPASPANKNIRTIPHLCELFRCEVAETLRAWQALGVCGKST